MPHFRCDRGGTDGSSPAHPRRPGKASRNRRTVPKGAGQEELLAAIRAVATGGAVFGAAVAGRMLAALDRTPAPAFPQLTDRESQVLTLLAEGWDNRRIAGELQVSTKTVANHVSHILTKLRARDHVDAVLRARGPERPR